MEEFARIPVLHALDQRIRPPLAALHRRPLPRHRKGRGGDHSEQGNCRRVRSANSTVSLQRTPSWSCGWCASILTMSAVAQKQDVSDPDVVAAFHRDRRRRTSPDGLYLLTVADIAAPAPRSGTAGRGSCCRICSVPPDASCWGRRGPTPHGGFRNGGKRRCAAALFCTLGDRPRALVEAAGHCLFPPPLGRGNRLATRAACTTGRTTKKPVVKARINPGAEGLQVMVHPRPARPVCPPGGFFFGRAGYSIADAKIHTTRHGYALDSFVLLDDRRTRQRPRDDSLHRARTDGPPAQRGAARSPLSTRVSRRLKHFPITPRSRKSDDKGANFVLSLVAADRPGLLYAVATTPRAMAPACIQPRSPRLANAPRTPSCQWWRAGTEQRPNPNRMNRRAIEVSHAGSRGCWGTYPRPGRAKRTAAMARLWRE